MTKQNLRQQEHLDVLDVQLIVDQLIDFIFLAADLPEDCDSVLGQGLAGGVLHHELKDLEQVEVLIPQEGVNHNLLTKKDCHAFENGDDDLLLRSIGLILKCSQGLDDLQKVGH